MDDEREPAEAPAEAAAPEFGPRGEPLQRHSPFYIGFFGAAGALLAYGLLDSLLLASGPLLLIVVSMFIAVGLSPLVGLLSSRGLPRAGAVTVVALFLLSVVTIFAATVVPVVRDQIATLIDNVPSLVDQARNSDVVQDLDDRFDLLDKIESGLTSSDLTSQVFGGALGVGLFVLSAIVNALILFILTLYFLAALPSIERGAMLVVPASRRERVKRLTDEVLRQIGNYVIGAVAVAAFAGVSATVFLTFTELNEYAVAFGLVVGLLAFIPMVGATIGAILVCAVAFPTSVGTGVACVIFFVVYQQVENYLVYPRVMARSMAMPGVLTVVAALVGGSLLGVVGALLAIPTAASLLFIVREVLVPRQQQH